MTHSSQKKTCVQLTLYKWVFIASFQRSQQIRKWTVFQIFYLWQLIWYGDYVILLLFLSSQKASFLPRTSLVLFTQKQRNKKVQSFNQKHGLTLFWPKSKNECGNYEKSILLLYKGASFLSRTSWNVERSLPRVSVLP